MNIEDDFLSYKEFNILKKVILSPDKNTKVNSFPWFLCEHDPAAQPFYFVHLFYVEDKINSEYFASLSPLLESIHNQNEIRSLKRIKGNFYPGGKEIILHDLHTDFPYSHKGAIYYLNSCDGYTLIGDEKVESVENRIVFFDASENHASTNCTDQKFRVNINFNYF